MLKKIVFQKWETCQKEKESLATPRLEPASASALASRPSGELVKHQFASKFSRLGWHRRHRWRPWLWTAPVWEWSGRLWPQECPVWSPCDRGGFRVLSPTVCYFPPGSRSALRSVTPCVGALNAAPRPVSFPVCFPFTIFAPVSHCISWRSAAVFLNPAMVSQVTLAPAMVEGCNRANRYGGSLWILLIRSEWNSAQLRPSVRARRTTHLKDGGDVRRL